MYAVTSLPFVSRTRATFRRAEFGFLGVSVRTEMQTPRFCGDPSVRTERFLRALKFQCKSGDLPLNDLDFRPRRTS